MTNHAPTAAPPRLCPMCGKRLARLNPGPTCFACEPHEPIAARARTRTRRSRLPHDEIVELYRSIGDITKVARHMDLPRSSVWYAVQRAKQDGRLGDMDYDNAA